MRLVPTHPSRELLVGRRALEGLPFLEMLDDWNWLPKSLRWGLHCRFRIESRREEIVPPLTDWYVLVPATYPWGDIDFYPAKKGGLELTFQHQSFNSFGDVNVPWRSGKICQQTSLRHFDRRVYDGEPMSPEDRLAWHVFRTQEWLVAASENNLVRPGDPFELPDFPIKNVSQTAFVEKAESFRRWSAISEKFGYAVVKQHQSNPNLFFVSSFMDSRRKNILETRFGTGLEKSIKSSGDALWIRLDEAPVLYPWQAPNTIGELLKVLAEKGVEFKAILQQLAYAIRDGTRHFVLLGFPIPRNIDEQTERFHWQALMLPVLSNGQVKGFERKESGYQRRDSALVLRDDIPLDWVASRNWDSEEIVSRGRLPVEVAKNKILVVGVGALGASLAQLLVRTGVTDLLLLDGDLLDVGNLCRHTEHTMNIGQYKAQIVATTLNAACPYANAKFINKKFGDCDESDLRVVEDRDVILDCTGNDAFLSELAGCEWATEKLFLSVSVGLFARRLFYFSYQGKSFPHDGFVQHVAPWVAKEANEYKGLKLPREGIGCWNPVFPARADDIWLMASMATKLFEYDSRHRPLKGIFRVFEQDFVDGLPTGLRKVHEVSTHA